MLSIIVVTFILLYLFTSAGYALFLPLHHEPRNPFLIFFIGFFVISVLGMTLSFFMPLNIYASLLCFIPSLVGTVPLLKRIRASFQKSGYKEYASAILCLFCIVSIFSFAASYKIWPGIAYDADLYHLQIVRWLNEYGTVVGLGNLHSRLANTSSWLIIVAILNQGILKGSVAWYMMPLFLSAFSAYFLYEVLYAHSIYQRIYALCILPVCVYAVVLWGYPHLYHDFPSLALTCIIGAELLYVLFEKDNTTIYTSLYIYILVTLAFLLKPLPVVTIVCVPLFLLYILWRRTLLTGRTVCLLFSLPVCAALLWCIRSAMLSGYPLFPVSVFPFDVDWRMAEQAVTGNALAVRAWARMPGAHYMEAFEKGIIIWFVPWLNNILRAKLPLLTLLLPLCLGCVSWYCARRRLRHREEWFLCLWPVLSIIYWFWLAPDPRFGTEYFWLFFAMGATCFARQRTEDALQCVPKVLSRASPSMAGIFLICFFMVLATGAVQRYWQSRALSGIAWFTPGTVMHRATLAHTIRHPDRTPFIIHVPIDDDRCGDAPLPCAPGFNANLIMRKDGELGAGFRMEKISY